VIFREVEDRDLIGRARRGDVESYNLLVSRWEKRGPPLDVAVLENPQRGSQPGGLPPD